MALKKGFCVHCQGDERLRIFNVNKTAEVCYCPHCTTPMPPKDAIENYRELISHHLRRASKYLFETTEYLLAYQTFAHIIDLDDTVKAAYYGRLLALVHLSTLRTSKINFAHIMHRQEMKIFHAAEICVEYYHFLVLLLDALDTYEVKMKKRLSNRGIFYDTDCVSLYLQRLDEIRIYFTMKLIISSISNPIITTMISNKSCNVLKTMIRDMKKSLKKNFSLITALPISLFLWGMITSHQSLLIQKYKHKSHVTIKSQSTYIQGIIKKVRFVIKFT